MKTPGFRSCTAVLTCAIGIAVTEFWRREPDQILGLALHRVFILGGRICCVIPGKQFEYEKERIELNGRKAVVHSWRTAEPRGIYKYEAEFRIYDAQGQMLVRMSAECKDRADVELAKRIFMTVEFP